MPRLQKDEKKVQLAQKAYDKALDMFLKLIVELNSDMPEVNDLLRGYAMGKKEEKYQLNAAQYGALKERFNLWKEFLKGPDKFIENINDKLRDDHKNNKQSKDGSSQEQVKPKVAIFKKTSVE